MDNFTVFLDPYPNPEQDLTLTLDKARYKKIISVKNGCGHRSGSTNLVSA
jgi:hypothetical protein